MLISLIVDTPDCTTPVAVSGMDWSAKQGYILTGKDAVSFSGFGDWE